MLAGMVLAGCSGDDDEKTAKNEEIRLNADVWQMMEGTRATTFDDQAALQTEGSFTCAVYQAGTTTPHFSTTTVNWNSSSSKWEFSDGKHYWPASGALDFWAYMPATPPSYISDLAYAAGPNVTFTCINLPMTAATQGSSLKEFVYGIALDQDKAGTNSTLQPIAGQVAMTFQHPFARIKLQLAASHPNVTINSITFRSIKNNGSYDLSGSPKWTTTGDDANFVLSLTGTDAVFDDNPATATQIGEYYIMIPQAWAGEIVVNADCLFWGDKINYPSLTTTLPTTWQPGYSYTYTFNISPDDLKVDTEKYTEQW